MPNAKFFPFKSIDFTLQDGYVLKSTDADVKEALQYLHFHTPVLVSSSLV